MAATTDVWQIPPETARRVGHPAPFPVELPEWLIDLYTYENDLVLDPFLGSGSTAVAAVRTGRRFVGYDLDEAYVAIARERVKEEEQRRLEREDLAREPVVLPAAEAPAPATPLDDADFQARASKEGKAAQALAEDVLTQAGFTWLAKNPRLPGLGMTMNFRALDDNGDEWLFDVSGAFSSARGGLRRTDTLWKALGRAHVLSRQPNYRRVPLVLLTSTSRSPRAKAIAPCAPRDPTRSTTRWRCSRPRASSVFAATRAVATAAGGEVRWRGSGRATSSSGGTATG